MIIKKQKDERGEFVILPENHNIKYYGEWIETPEGLLLKRVDAVNIEKIEKICKKLHISKLKFLRMALDHYFNREGTEYFDFFIYEAIRYEIKRQKVKK